MIYNLLKRIFDLVLSIILLTILSPFLIIITIIVLFETGQKPVFVQERGLSLTKKRFRIYKFRTFKKDEIQVENNSKTFLVKRSEEALITSFGRFLRKSGLDEIPQLINIIKGDMSLIGPRPLSISDLENMKKFYPVYYKRRDVNKIKPGLSGLWQINKGEDYSVHKLGESEELYFKKRSLVYDAILLLKTIKVVLSAKHNDAIIKTIFNYNSSKQGKLKTKCY